MKSRSILSILAIVSLFLVSTKIKTEVSGQSTLASHTVDDNSIPYGERTPECLNPHLSHLCGDMDKDSDGRFESHHVVLVTCRDHCGAVYSFPTEVLFINRNGNWEPEESLQFSMTNLKVLSRATTTDNDSKEKEDIENERKKARKELADLVQQTAATWNQIVGSFPVEVINDENGAPACPSYFWSFNASSLNDVAPVMGHLTQLFAQSQSLYAQMDNQNEEGIIELQKKAALILQMAAFLSANQATLNAATNPSLTHLKNIRQQGEEISSQLGIFPQKTGALLKALSSNSQLIEASSRAKELADKFNELNTRAEQLNRAGDHSADDPNVAERCLDYQATTSEVYPTHSVALKGVLKEVGESILPRLNSLEAQARDLHTQFINSLPSASQEEFNAYRATHPEFFVGMVRVNRQPGPIESYDEWTLPLFKILERNSDPREKSLALQLLNNTCSSLSFLNKVQGLSNAGNSSSALPGTAAGGPRYLQIHFHVGASELLLDTWINEAGTSQGLILILDKSKKVLALKDACISLNGFCPNPDEQVHLGSVPFLDLDMPVSGGISRRVAMPVYHVDQNTFSRRLKKVPTNF